MKLAVIVPEYNEGQRVLETVNNILDCFSGKIIVVDDGSIDGSYKLLKKKFEKNNQIILIRHAINLGKGAAMKTGIEIAKKLKCNEVIFVDADGQHNPKYIPDFIELLKKNDIVFGYRLLNNEMPFIRKWGNILAKRIIKILFKVDRKEFLCGYMGFNMDIYKKINWMSNRYGVETEIATKVSKNNLSYKEIKIDTIYVDKYKGVSLIDAVKVLVKIPFWYFVK